jgi:hypothetical protein
MSEQRTLELLVECRTQLAAKHKKFLATRHELDAATEKLNELAEINKELLETLKEATEFVDLHSEDWYKSGRALVDKCKAAINKAEQQ